MLADGLAVVDPLEELTPEERHEREMATKCCLCEQKEATRKCGPCGDQFCTDCFLSSHAHGARQKHAWERIGRPICESCVKNFAFRWCAVRRAALRRVLGHHPLPRRIRRGGRGPPRPIALPDGSKKRFTGHVSSRDPAHAFFAIGARNGRVAETSEEEVFGAGDDDDEEKDATPEDGWIPLQDDQGVTTTQQGERLEHVRRPARRGARRPRGRKAAAAAADSRDLRRLDQYDDGEGPSHRFNSRTGESTTTTCLAAGPPQAPRLFVRTMQADRDTASGANALRRALPAPSARRLVPIHGGRSPGLVLRASPLEAPAAGRLVRPQALHLGRRRLVLSRISSSAAATALAFATTKIRQFGERARGGRGAKRRQRAEEATRDPAAQDGDAEGSHVAHLRRAERRHSSLNLLEHEKILVPWIV